VALFDGLRNNAFGVVTNTMGYTAVWTPSDSEIPQTAKVLFKDATTDETLQEGNIHFNVKQPVIEYLLPDFNGLKSLVDDAQRIKETITITLEDGDKTYVVNEVITISDGRNHKAFLTLKES
jgi:hypothetical protein